MTELTEKIADVKTKLRIHQKAIQQSNSGSGTKFNIHPWRLFQKAIFLS